MLKILIVATVLLLTSNAALGNVIEKSSINWNNVTLIADKTQTTTKKQKGTSSALKIPDKAFLYKEIIKEELDNIFPDIPEYNYIPSLIEHESCISLTHSRCWSPTSRLKTSREEGAGLGQLTRAYRSDGTIRFDKLTELKAAYKTELKDLYWDNIYQRPDLQIRAIVLLVRSDNNRLREVSDPVERLKMTDVAYNGGIGGLLKERRACGLAKGCDADVWFNNVELYCLKSKRILYSNRNACDINRHHAEDVFHHKLPKYKKYYYTQDIEI